MAEPFLLDCDMYTWGRNKGKTQVLSSRKSQLKITELMGKTELRQISQNQCNFIIKALTKIIRRPYKNTGIVQSPLEFAPSIMDLEA